MTLPSLVRAVACSAALAAVGVHIQAMASGCWATDVTVLTTNDDSPFHHRKFAALHVALDEADQMLRPNPGLLALLDVRLRMSRQILGSEEPGRLPRAAVLHGQGFGPKAWGRGPCELIPQASRLGPRAGIRVFFNQPFATLNRWKHDEQLTTYLGRPATPEFQGWPTFGECAVISRGRRLPWVPVTVGEMLAFEVREQQRQIEAFDRDNAAALEPCDPTPHLRDAEAIRTQSPKAADAILLAVRQRQAMEPTTRAGIAQGRARLVADLDALRQRLNTLDAAARAAPYRHSQAAGASDVVRLDPDFPWDARRLLQVQLVTVCAPQLERNPAYHLPMREAVATLDFARLAALLN